MTNKTTDAIITITTRDREDYTMNKIRTRKMMKRQMMMNNIRAMIVVSIIIVLLAITSYVSTTYTREACVDSITEDVVVFVDNTGNTWEYDNVDVVEGQRVILVMNTSYTDNIIDDDIIKDIKPTDIK